MRKLEVTKAQQRQILSTKKTRAPGAGRPAKRKGTIERQKRERAMSAKREAIANMDSAAIAITGTAPLWQCPQWFDEDERAQWQYGMDNSPKGLLSAGDRELLIIWCQASVLHARASQAIRKDGAVLYSAKKGVTFINPWVTIQNQQAMVMMKTGDQMGFSPLSRAHIARLVLVKLDQEELLKIAKQHGATDADFQTVDGFTEGQPSEFPVDDAGPND